MNNIKKNIVFGTIGSALNAFNSLFFMIIVTRINGSDKSGIFSFAFSTACLFYIIGVYSGRTFQVTDDDKNIKDSDYLYSKIITCIIMILVGLLFCIIRHYNSYKTIIIMGLVIFKSLEAFSEVMYAIVQENDQLYKVGISMSIKALSSLILFLIVDYLTHNIIISIIAINILNILIMLIYDMRNLKLLLFSLKKIDYHALKLIFKSGFNTFLFTLLTQYVLSAPKYSIDSLLTNKDQTIFSIIFMPATIMSLLGQFIIQPFLLKIKNTLKSSKKSFLKLNIYLGSGIVVSGLLIILCTYFLGIPMLEILYNIELNEYLKPLLIIISGGLLYAIALLLSTSLTTMRSTFSQLLIYIIATILTYILSNYLVGTLGILGASYAYLLTMTIITLLYIFTFLIVLKKYGGIKNEKI